MNIEVSAATPFAIPDGVFAQQVTLVEHFTDRLFRFRITRKGGKIVALTRINRDGTTTDYARLP